MCDASPQLIAPWLLDVARELAKVVEGANHMGTATFTANGATVRVTRTVAAGVKAEFDV